MPHLLHQLLIEKFDYAGLYPPAELGMAEMVEAFIRHAESEETLLLQRAVVPASRLPEFGVALVKKPVKDQSLKPVPITVTATPAMGLDGWKMGLQIDADAIDNFLSRFEAEAGVEAFETVLPVGHSTGDVLEDLDAISGVDVYLELPWEVDFADELSQIEASEWLAAKLRCGGRTAAQVPSAEALASVLVEILSLDVRFKLTAGLHHPFRKVDPLLGVPTHGFLNVLLGMGLQYANELNVDELAEILLETDPKAFRFGLDDVSWRDARVDFETLDDVAQLCEGIGTCSIQEVVDDLKALGLWQEVLRG